ncbi:MAG: GNAT family N-acetyltransferase, partial [Chloroflexi bacterium]|nr:GNAT family N-acetyltransferase [Chloroflexota bacterium]
RRLARAMFDEGWLRLSFLQIEGRRAASTFSFDYGGTVSLYNSGFDPEFAHLSVGVAAAAFSIQDCLALGRRTMDFLRGDEPYKYDFGAIDRAIFNIKCQKR